ncbi:MAG: NAD(P)-dependent oxidoreductase [Halofilum sp. (in: g-proteobacteria)]
MGADASIERVAFIGLGVMGGPMAGHLARAGYDVAVYNRTADKASEWSRTYGGRVASTPAQAAAGAQVVCACVGRDADLRAITLDRGGAFEALEPGAVFVDHTTVSAAIARELAEAAAQRGAGFVDAPVSGGQAGAEQGRLAIMAGGSEADFARVEPVLRSYSARLVHVGGPGAGQLTKMVNQICIGGLIQALAEGVDFAQRSDLDLERVLEVIGGGAAQSWQMDNRAQTMAEGRFDFGFAVEWMRKDLEIVLDEARRNGATLPLTALVDQFYGQLQQRGHAREDTSSLIRLLADS